jgi:hypothetical protein
MSEIFVFNLRFWDSMGYTPTVLNSITVGDGLAKNDDGSYTFSGEKDSYIELKNINQPVKNIYIGISSYSPYRQLITLEATDEGNKLYYKLPQREIVPGVERSKYIKLQTAGASEKLRIDFNSTPYYDTGMTVVGYTKAARQFKIDSIVINKPVPFSFNPLRLLILYSFILLLYLLRYGTEIFKYKLKAFSVWQLVFTLALIGINIAFAVFIYKNNLEYYTWDRNVYPNLATSLLDGRFDLPMIKSSPKLAQMENPYDTYLRDKVTGGTFGWDYAYYNGKYYVYFGIVPCLILFLPLKAAFGIDLHANLAMLIFTIIYIIVGFRFIYSLARRFFKDISFAMYLMMAELFVFCSMLTPFLSRNDLYGIPNITALTFTMLGIDLWLCSLGKDGKIKSFAKMFLGSLCMALVAGCRPQLVLGSFFAVIIFWNNVFGQRDLLSVKGRGLVNTLAFMLPYIAVAAGLMYYNYARFGSVTDFGAMYNLTTNDMTKRGFRIDRMPYGLYAYLFQLPNIFESFPFFANCAPVTKYMGVTIYEHTYGGVFFITPVLLFSLFAYTKTTRTTLKARGMLLPVALCHLFAFIIVFADITMSCVTIRYMSDFVWLLMLAAFAVILCLIEYVGNENKRRLRYIFSITFMVSMVINILLVFVRYRMLSMNTSNPDVFYGIMYAIEFWM